ncbi:hypothetical protein GCM10027036_40490 [Flavihumibacter cheonanensis]|uniref:phosphatase PAP2 family protein n=1 Tax=Flavihumibacter cheonanensis TaxID=1442385 RepID=UPI001EF9A970|nr:phosphatase PAP2 family protein [Flavihumibacter cheonanensis]MCG7754646.1 phosphatase PAP2 family protein [Flavihumibacter cheonanensis]
MTFLNRCLFSAIFFVFCLPVFGQEDSLPANYYRINKTYIGSYFTDFPKVVTAPARYSSKDWRTVAIVVAGTGAMMTLDRSIKQWVQANRNNFLSQTSRIIEPFGNEYSPYLVGAMYLTGVLTKDRRMEHVSLVSAKSLVFTTLLTAGSKQLVRRRRPAYTDDPFEFNSMFQGGREWTSFPSGHANTVFTVATAIALQYNDKKWVPYVAYGIAGLTGVSRIYDNRHWATDVIVGAAMGHFITKTLYRIEEAKARKKELRSFSF